jgi:hypothetical protein
MSPHVSLFEVHAFVTRGEATAEFEAHVSACDVCAGRLSSSARRVVSPASAPAEVVTPRLQVALVAFVACLAVLSVRAVAMPLPLDASPPEGVHGIAPQPVAQFSTSAEPVDSGVR